VLEEDQWGVAELDIEAGKVVSSRIVRPGVYGLDGDTCPGPGWTLEQIAEWTRLDMEEQHPAQYNEVWVSVGWDNFVMLDTLEWLTREEVKAL
jgi:hypothetical protein